VTGVYDAPVMSIQYVTIASQRIVYQLLTIIVLRDILYFVVETNMGNCPWRLEYGH